MNTTTGDILAVILSFVNMSDQLQCQGVCKSWKNLVDRHPFLFHHLDFGDPERFPSRQIASILKKAGSRVRSLRICTFPFPTPLGLGNKLVHNRWNDINIAFKDAILLVVARLEKLIVVGHIMNANGTSPLLNILSMSSSPTVTLIAETCPCCVNLLHLQSIKDGGKVEVQSAICESFSASSPYICVVCHKAVIWARSCPVCLGVVCCSECSFQWDWSVELNDGCRCAICLPRTLLLHPVSLSPPIWTCTTHCRSHRRQYV